MSNERFERAGYRHLSKTLRGLLVKPGTLKPEESLPQREPVSGNREVRQDQATLPVKREKERLSWNQ